MLSLFKCLCLIIIILITGDAVNLILFKKKHKNSLLLRFSLSYGFGTGALGILMFCLSYIGFRLTLTNILLLTLPFIALFIFNAARSFKKSYYIVPYAQKFLRENGLIEYIFIILIVTSLALIFFKALFLPMHLPDDRAQWGMKAKVLYHDKTIYSDDFFEPLIVKLHVKYPFLIPLLESAFYTFMGEMNDTLVKTPFPFYFISLLCFIYASQRRFSSHRHALIFTAMIAVLPVFIQDARGSPSSGYADIPLALYYTVAAVSLFHWLQAYNRCDLLLAALFMGFAVFTKQEGTILWITMICLIIFIILFSDIKNKTDRLKSMSVFVVLPAVINIPWFLFRSTIISPAWDRDWSITHINTQYIISHIGRVKPIMTAMLKSFFSISHWNFLWIIFFLFIFLYPKKSFKLPQSFILILVGVNIITLFMAVVMYPWNWWYNFLNDINRLLIINVPLMVFFISYQIYKTKKLTQTESMLHF